MASKRKICVFTGTRADYGLLYFLLKGIESDDALELQLLVSGMHLSPAFGNTYQQIEADGFVINEKVEMLVSGDSATAVAKSLGLGTTLFSDSLTRLNPDILVVLGDRFEALAVAQAALILQIPICHLHGGEISEGAYDDAIRHAITKFSLYHITSCENHRRRVIQLGEVPERVFNFGAPGLEYPQRNALLSRAAFYDQLGLDQNLPFLLLTYHPVTSGNEPPKASIDIILSAFEAFSETHQFLITFPNADNGGQQIISTIENYAEKSNTVVVKSLGQKRYFSALKHCDAVLGNSSSALIEAPFFKTPSVNIGIRQKGRLAPDSVLHCKVDKQDVEQKLACALSEEFAGKIDKADSLFGDGKVSEKVISLLKSASLDPYKTFYNCDFDYE